MHATLFVQFVTSLLVLLQLLLWDTVLPPMTILVHVLAATTIFCYCFVDFLLLMIAAVVYMVVFIRAYVVHDSSVCVDCEWDGHN